MLMQLFGSSEIKMIMAMFYQRMSRVGNAIALKEPTSQTANTKPVQTIRGRNPAAKCSYIYKISRFEYAHMFRLAVSRHVPSDDSAPDKVTAVRELDPCASQPTVESEHSDIQFHNNNIKSPCIEEVK